MAVYFLVYTDFHAVANSSISYCLFTLYHVWCLVFCGA